MGREDIIPKFMQLIPADAAGTFAAKVMSLM
jgi:hypothetical protein